MNGLQGRMSGLSGLLRLALVAVMALVFGMGGFVVSAEAVTYYMQPSTANLGGITANYGDCSVQLTTPITTAMNTTTASVCGGTTGGRVNITAAAPADMVLMVSDTAYASDMLISGQNITASLRNRGGGGEQITYTLGYVTGGAFTPFTITAVEARTIGNVQADFATPFNANTGTAPAGSRLALKMQETGAAANQMRVYFTTTSIVLTVTETRACADTNGSAVTLTNPANASTVSGSIAITTSLTNAATAEYSIAGGAWTPIATLWNSANTHPGSTTAPVAGVTVDVRAIEDECGGYVTDSISVTVDNTCIPSGSLAITAGQTLNGNPINLTSITPNVNASGVNYRVTTGSTSTGVAVNELENFGNAGGQLGEGWSANWTTDNTSSPPAAGDSLGTGSSTASGSTGPQQVLNGDFLYYEGSSPAAAGSQRLFTHVSPFDAAQTELAISFDYNMYGAGMGTLSLEVSVDGGAWVTEWTASGDDANTGTWGNPRVSVDLWNGSGLSATQYRSGNVNFQFRFAYGSSYQTDMAIDEVLIAGPAAVVSTEVVHFNGTATAAQSASTTGWTDGGTYNLEVTGNDATCGTPLTAATGTFTWSACTETATLTLNPITDPITGNVSVTASGSATGIQVGIVPAPTNASGWIYIPAQDDNTTTVSFYATGSGTCGPLTASQLNLSTNTMAAPTVTAFSVPATVTSTFVVPVTTFTASDNLGITGYLITESASAPAAGAAGWSGTAPASYTVPAYNTYTLYAWAKDAVGNVSLSASASTTVSNCVEAGSVTVSISPDPDPADITGPVTVTANLGGGATNGKVRWSVDGGPWNVWVASGSTFTPPNVRTGSIGFEAMADGSCGASSPVYSTGIVRTYETRVDPLEPVTYTAAQNGLTGIRVHMGYHNDKNSTGSFLVEYKLASEPTTWTTPANIPTTDGGAGDADATRDEEIFVDLSGLTSGETYDIRMTFADATDGLIGAAVYNVQVTLVSWADNPLLHNSNRFTGTTKHTGNWGKPGDYAGAILCNTCHGKNTGNVKRIKADISFPDGSTMPGGGISAAVSLQTVGDGTSDFGDDSTAPRASSNRVCEVCHTYDGSQTVGVKQHASNQGSVANHYDNSDCIKCHQHSTGFRADCTTCHGNPPLVAGELTATLNPVNNTGSTTAGKHAYHVTTKGYGCNTCHTGWEATGEMPKNGNLNLGFNIVLGTTTDTTGTYDGRSTGGGYTAAAGTSITTGNGLSCSAIYCHGTAAPAWTAAGTAACGSCHGDINGMPSATPGDGDLSGATSGSQVGKHPEHVVNAGLACSTCHKDLGFGTPDHVNGSVDIWFDTVVAGASATYNNATNTCSNLSCHISKVWDTATPASCDMCHGYPPLTDGSANDLHVAGATPVDHSGVNITSKHDECNLCHGYSQAGGATDNTGNGGDLYQVSYHRDNNIEMNGISAPDNAQSAEYDQATFGCAKACHANDAAHQLSNSGLTVVTHEYGSGSCTGCHDGTGTGATLVNDNSSHALASTGLQCEECHGSHGGGTIEIPNNPAVGINYTANGETGIALGVATTAPGATEAEICWNCHGATYNEFGVNNKANTGSMAYNYGTLNQSNWVGATWTSGTAKFGYKTGPIQSTHSVNPAATGPGMDAVGTIRCSYCHDVHDLNLATGDSLSGAPYLRGTWMGNPYREDGAPQTGDTWTASGNFGAVPRGGTQSVELGGYQIDQNNGNPTAVWTANSSAGLCELCHGNGDGNFTAAEIDSLNQFGTASTDWVGTNGHSAAVLGGGDSVAANIFTVTDRNTNPPTWINNDAAGDAGNPAMAQQHVRLNNATGNRAFSFRSSTREPDGWNLTPRIAREYAQDGYNWGANTQTALDSNYHNFSCSKCHNPHASRLPRLMITNCLDTKHNTWDNGQSTIPNGTTNVDGSATVSANNSNVKFSQATSAQNCHREKDPAFTQSRGTGWNNVTPW